MGAHQARDTPLGLEVQRLLFATFVPSSRFLAASASYAKRGASSPRGSCHATDYWGATISPDTFWYVGLPFETHIGQMAMLQRRTCCLGLSATAQHGRVFTRHPLRRNPYTIQLFKVLRISSFSTRKKRSYDRTWEDKGSSHTCLTTAIQMAWLAAG